MKDAGHLFRFAGLFVIAFLVFLIVRGYVVPKSFGQYGHYRGAAIGEIASRPVRFAGHQECEGCHTDIADTKSKGKHAHVNCEACHGALAAHADDPTSVTPVKPDTAVLCARCHTRQRLNLKTFPRSILPITREARPAKPATTPTALDSIRVRQRRLPREAPNEHYPPPSSCAFAGSSRGLEVC